MREGDRMKIAWVKVGGLWPPETGGRLRSFHLVSELSRRHALTLLTTHGRSEDAAELARRLPHCEVVSFPFDIPKRTSAAFARALARSWLSPLPVDLLKFRVPALAAELRRRARRGEIDLCVGDFLSATVNLPGDGSLPVLFFAHNVEHMIWRRLCAVERRPWLRLPLAIEWRKMRRSEGRICAGADLTVAVSEKDAATLAAVAPGAAVCAIPTGVDPAYYTPAGREAAGPGLVFTGSMDWYPNEDAVLYFQEEILPLIRGEEPEATLTVVGRNPTRRLRAAARAPGVRLTGTVPDVRPFLAEAAAYVVPLRIGGGTRLKIFEALAAGKAVVSTTVGAEGLPLVPGVHFLRADEPAEFARQVVALLRDPRRRRDLGEAGRRLVEQRFAWPQVATEFEAHCRRAAARIASTRRAGAAMGRLSVRRSIRHRLPRGIATWVRALRTLEAGQILIFWGLRLRRAMGIREAARPEPSGSVRSVVYVCRGNIIRSPMAEAILKRSLDGAGVTVSSAGLYAEKGRPADPRARIAARQLGFELEGHRAQRVTPAMMQQASLIVPLDALIEAELRGRYPEAGHKIAPLRADHGGGGRPIEIPDPYDGDVAEIRRCYELIGSCVRRQASDLMAGRTAGAEVKASHAR